MRLPASATLGCPQRSFNIKASSAQAVREISAEPNIGQKSALRVLRSAKLTMPRASCGDFAGGGRTANNLVSVQYICDSHPSRRWRLIGSNGVYRIANLQTGKCLTIAGGRSTANNVEALQYNCDDDRSRTWELRRVTIID